MRHCFNLQVRTLYIPITVAFISAVVTEMIVELASFKREKFEPLQFNENDLPMFPS
jgi:hypothetical protein